MAWFECIGGNGGGGPSENAPMLLFGDGEWQNTDKFDIVTSQSGASDLSIVDGCLIYDGATGFSVTPSNPTDHMAICVEFEKSPTSNGFIQTGRCVVGADAKVVMSTGSQRYSYHDATISGTETCLWTNTNSVSNNALFVAGSNLKIKHIYVWIGNMLSWAHRD